MRRSLLVLLLAPALALGLSLQPITAADTGLAAATLAGGATTRAIPLLGSGAMETYNQVTLAWVVVPGSSSTMTVTCSGSVDNGSTYRAIERCADGATFTCTAATWSYDVTTQTSGLLNVPASYTHIKCTFTATGTGTVTVTGAKNRI